ncbi:hypothetical protein QTP86_019396 [Hemibagrus guttatus]|nr:hypothetical protein QTP86_019396 [Hemibagrus guttatus]
MWLSDRVPDTAIQLDGLTVFRANRNAALCDLEKAYDRVPREELWYCMRKSGVAEKYVRVVQDMYERSRTVVRCAVGQTEEFNVEVGLHQGLALSPFLFAIVMDQLSEEVRAFNTIIPQHLIENLSPEYWAPTPPSATGFLDFLTGRPQSVRIGNSFSSTTT